MVPTERNAGKPTKTSGFFRQVPKLRTGEKAESMSAEQCEALPNFEGDSERPNRRSDWPV